MKISTTIFRQTTLVVFLFFAFSLSVFGAEETATLSFANKAQRTSFFSTKQVWQQDGITFTNNKASSSNAVADYANPVRLYANSEIIVEFLGNNITKIVFDCNNGSYATTLKNSIGNNSATVSSDKVTVTLDGTSTSFIVAKLTAQVRLDKITVTYESNENDPPTIEVSLDNIDFGDVEQNEEITKNFTIKGKSIVGEIFLVLSNTDDFSIDKTSITSEKEESIIVSLNTQTIGKKTGKITISSEGAESQTVNLSANVITPKQRFNVNFYHNGERQYTLQIAEGESIGTFPSIDGLVSCNPNLPIFVGWTSEYIGYENVENKTAPNFFDPTTPINHDVDLYAVFADASSTSIWYHVKNISDLTDGSKVLIVCPTKDVAAGEQYGTYRKSTLVSLSNNQVTDIQEAKIFTLGVTSSGYTFYSDDENHYLYYGGSGNELNAASNIPNSSDGAYWDISISNGNANILNQKYGTRKLQYNASSPRFACYTTKQTEIALYKHSHAIATKWTICIPYAYSATFHINANSSVVVNDINPGTAISDIEGVPTLLNSCDDDFWSFAGWTTATESLVGYVKPEIVATITDDVNLYPVFSNAYAQLATDASQLQVNDKIIIVAKDYDYALSTNQRDNNRGQIEITKIDNKIGLNDGVQIITLGEGTQDNTLSFYTGTGYLYAASSTSNHLKTQGTNNANGSWDISITNSVAKVVAKGTNTHSHLQYNSASNGKLFSCYFGFTQEDISIYELVDATQWVVCHNSVLNIESDEVYNLVTDVSVDNLTIKSNLDQAGQLNTTNASIIAGNVTIEKTIDASRYFFFSLPFDCNITDIEAFDVTAPTTPLSYYYNYTIFYYDQVKAANNKGAMGSKAWVEITDKNATLKANQGYIIGYLVDEGIATIKFKSSDAQTISAPATTTLNIDNYTWYTAGEVATANGWNLIGMPYYQKPNNGSLSADINVYYATMPNDDGKTYTQTTFADADIAPFTSFFVQTEVAPTFTISAQQNAAPKLIDGRANYASQQKAVIAFADANGAKDQTTIINNPNTTADYEIGHDLVKWIGYAAIPQIYSIQGDDILAFNSRAIDSSTIIPLGVYAHADGEYTFSLDAKSVGDLQGWELYDKVLDRTVRLANEAFTIYLEKGKHEGRFELRLQQRVPTDCDNTMSDILAWTETGRLNLTNLPVDAVVYLYDAVGHMLHATTTPSTSMRYHLPIRGIYNIVIYSAAGTITLKTIY